MNQSQSKISIVCVTYNAAQYIERCLQSIFNQVYSNIEIVIVDGNSTDGTQDILKRYNDKIAFWKSEPDKGIYDAMNKALGHVTGDWVYFMGADDELLPDFSIVAEKELLDPNTVYYANVMHKGEKQAGEMSPYRQLKNGLLHQSIIYPISVFKKYKYSLDYKISADTVLNLSLYGDKQFIIEYKDYTIANFNEGGVSTYSKDAKLLQDLPKLALKHFGLKIYLRFMIRRIKYSITGKHKTGQKAV